MKQRDRTTRLALVCFIGLLPLSACKVGSTDLGNVFSFPAAGWTRVFVHNATLDVFAIYGANLVPVGASSSVLGHPSSLPDTNNPNSFEISRQSQPLARVTYRVLRFPPPPQSQDVFIVITEEPAGVFLAATPDSTSTWIQVLSVQPL